MRIAVITIADTVVIIGASRDTTLYAADNSGRVALGMQGSDDVEGL